MHCLTSEPPLLWEAHYRGWLAPGQAAERLRPDPLAWEVGAWVRGRWSTRMQPGPGGGDGGADEAQALWRCRGACVVALGQRSSLLFHRKHEGPDLR